MSLVGSVFNLSPEQLAHYTQRMTPGDSKAHYYGPSALSGFLAHGQDLLECCQADKDTLDGYKVTHEQLADRLLDLVEKGQSAGLGELVEGKFEVTINSPYARDQYCPFSGEFTDHPNLPRGQVNDICGSGYADVTIRNTKNGKEIRFGSLLMHLIKKHYFFEGYTGYRLDPQEAIEVLELDKPANKKSGANKLLILILLVATIAPIIIGALSFRVKPFTAIGGTWKSGLLIGSAVIPGAGLAYIWHKSRSRNHA